MEQAKKILKEWVIPLALEATVVILFIKFVVFLAVVPTGSMFPTVAEGSWHVTTRMYNPEKNVNRGDIIVFYSDELEKVLFKRCIGLPGEAVQVKEDGKVYINGEYLEEPYVIFPSEDARDFQVPEGCYLFLGDNRAGSDDARFWNDPYVSGDKIMGEARFTIFPFNDFGVLH